MIKRLLALLLIAFSFSKADYVQYGTGICLLRILIKNLKEKQIDVMDEATTHLFKLLNVNDYDTFVNFNDIKLVQHLNFLLLSYDFLDQELKDEIDSCNIDLSKIKERCEEYYGKGTCEQKNKVSYIYQCPKNTINSNNYECFNHCELEFEEGVISCVKAKAKLMGPYSRMKECIERNPQGCDPYYSNSVMIPRCPKYFKRSFRLYCSPICPPGFIDDGPVCYKRMRIDLPPPIVFSFNDLYDVKLVTLLDKKLENKLAAIIDLSRGNTKNNTKVPEDKQERQSTFDH